MALWLFSPGIEWYTSEMTRRMDSNDASPRSTVKQVNITRRASALQGEIDELLVSGRAHTMAEAENMVLDAHLPEIPKLAGALSNEDFDRHELVRLLLAHGSRSWEDSLA